MKIKKGEVLRLKLKLVKPFVTSFAEIKERDVVLVKLYSKDNYGVGEAPVLALPLYNSETPDSSTAILTNTFLPLIINKEIDDPTMLNTIFAPFKGNEFSKSALDVAFYDLVGKNKGVKLMDILGAQKRKVTVSRTISIHKTVDDCLDEAGGYIKEGATYLKLKIKPGFDLAYAKALMKKFPQIKLMLDANSAYTLNATTLKTFKELDKLKLYCIEQPLESVDIIDHAKLQKELTTPIALDESIESEYDMKKAIELDSCKLVNIKIARVGGITSACQINKVCKKHGIKTWVGGMLESPVGFYANLALSTLDNFSYPIDFLGALSYIKDFDKFFVNKPYEIKGNFLYLKITKPGLGLDLDEKFLDHFIAEKIVIK
ncbi:MAG: o-succinylbenzoic acid (OSB) synthetase [Microgenomates group bacterium GW2011_GWC1_37_8]|uniref:o-succinylbenzoate synthase n=1 Tax=Candidatus Woesebacteria bacterium GW2011_GWB1_38_8 TaxID=1618570 RepID=A0A0G0NIY1_9BACT|nr:MAG: o-succinylbenzoic acid (OSB) synthetase [Microgenomates group bacterium GW2011_GWC1_37_8]KKQ85859.1 MAG: o-succinylbenzoic acid (OSB) synthetase [Candidatus Woesebacteria bacterium GW2011_GWB1_38_8]